MSAEPRRRNVHPFPARMAPEIALTKIADLTEPGGVVLDPMCGSGTVPRLALEQDRNAIACDMDPLAVMMTRTACKPRWSVGLESRAQDTVREALLLDNGRPDWIDADPDSGRFVDYWFAPLQQAQLNRLARILVDRPTTDDPLRIALSRLIVTKDGGASLARDTSHSRPHRVRATNDFNVYEAFVRAASLLEPLVRPLATTRSTSIRTVDARVLPFLNSAGVDLVLTSPPYLNAIDYLRGHRMSLVWLGWKMSDLRKLRGESIGADRQLMGASTDLTRLTHSAVPALEQLSERNQRLVLRFAGDVQRLCRTFTRVVKPNGHVVLVVADSQVRGVPVPNSEICRVMAETHGLVLVDCASRPLPSQHRYLPPPTGGAGTLNTRMREELVLTFRRRSSSTATR